jgi:hypothetical protein
MKIRFLTSIADVTGWSYDYGEVAEVTDRRAKQFIRNGHAEAADADAALGRGPLAGCERCGQPAPDGPYCTSCFRQAQFWGRRTA